MKEYPIVTALTKQIRRNGRAWLIIGTLQLVGAVLWFGDILRRGQLWWFIPFLITVEGIKNISRGYRDLKFAGRLWHTPTGIIRRYKTSAAVAEAFIDNILVGAVIGLIGCVMLQKTRGFVLKNLTEFQQIENDFIIENR